MADVIREITVEALAAFADAFNRHDADAVVSFMTEDCVFEASAGPDICGARYVGREAVRAAFADVFATFSDAQWGDAQHSSREIAASPNGPSPARVRMARASRFMAATCSHFATVRSP